MWTILTCFIYFQNFSYMNLHFANSFLFDGTLFPNLFDPSTCIKSLALSNLNHGPALLLLITFFSADPFTIIKWKLTTFPALCGRVVGVAPSVVFADRSFTTGGEVALWWQRAELEYSGRLIRGNRRVRAHSHLPCPLSCTGQRSTGLMPV